MPAIYTPTPPDTDPVFFFSIVHIYVEGILFGIPNYVCELSKSESFRAKVAEQPCVLEDVAAAEFRDFLQCLIALGPEATKKAEELGEPPESESDDGSRVAYMRRWLNAIKLATHWNFEDARRKAIRKIHQMDDPPLKLAVACKYDVQRFLPDALRDLADTKIMTPLNKEDYEILGLDLALKVVQFREEWNAQTAGAGDTPEKDRREQLIETIFGAEFAKGVEQGELENLPKLFSCPVAPGRRRAQRG
ncbi:hypothetical protein GSI_04795 [Ganoderma sinense ZZ0214-1]|uniref:BTB domain-containing protein n=1 Tax=Ganoderma sinense ZZ0214-1 TaxID=1077348 RepID=A0A2G8SHU0_9APHY|nr:hypothetical protein GSI_04795 [Ganoderma sinense ZZ0214-1]